MPQTETARNPTGFPRGRALIAALMVALGLRIVLGAQWFSLYGIATTVLLALVPVGAIVHDTLRRPPSHSRWRLWLLWLLIAVTVLAALVQIGFWLTFFHGRDFGLFLGIGRSMVVDRLPAVSTPVIVSLTLIWTALLLRAGFQRFSTKAP